MRLKPQGLEKEDAVRTTNRQSIGRLACLAAIVLGSNLTTQAQPPDNAALLYYQAFLEYEGTQDESEGLTIRLFQSGYTDSNDVVVSYIERNRRAIDLAVTAADITRCDWGCDPSQFDSENDFPYIAKIRQISFAVLTETRWLIEQGDFQAAWDRCMTMHKMAVHAGSDEMWITYLVALSLDRMAIRSIQEALSLAPADVNTLTQLKVDLPRTMASFPSPTDHLRQGFRTIIANVDRGKYLSRIRRALESDEYFERREEMAEKLLESDEVSPDFAREYVDMFRNRDAAMERLLQGDEAFFQRNRDYIVSAVDRLTSTIEMNLPYTQTCAALDELAERIDEEMVNDPNAALAVLDGPLGPRIKGTYEMTIQRQAHLNAVLAAFDIYIARARTGQLPEELPSDSPPDPFSGLPFEYVKTAEGFTLSCRGENVPEAEADGYEFKISQ